MTSAASSSTVAKIRLWNSTLPCTYVTFLRSHDFCQSSSYVTSAGASVMMGMPRYRTLGMCKGSPSGPSAKIFPDLVHSTLTRPNSPFRNPFRCGVEGSSSSLAFLDSAPSGSGASTRYAVPAAPSRAPDFAILAPRAEVAPPARPEMRRGRPEDHGRRTGRRGSKVDPSKTGLCHGRTSERKNQQFAVASAQQLPDAQRTRRIHRELKMPCRVSTLSTFRGLRGRTFVGAAPGAKARASPETSP